jgi:hypothetical protein
MIWRSIVWQKFTEVSEEHNAAIFRIDNHFLLAYSTYFTTLMIQAVNASETLVKSYWTIRHHIRRDNIFIAFTVRN